MNQEVRRKYSFMFRYQNENKIWERCTPVTHEIRKNRLYLHLLDLSKTGVGYTMPIYNTRTHPKISEYMKLVTGQNWSPSDYLGKMVRDQVSFR